MKKIILAIIQLYKFVLSPWIGQNCRYFPTCSDYAKESIQKFGTFKGCLIAGKRICSCHPYSHRPAFDPVPERFDLGEFIGYTVRSTTEKKK